MKRRDIHMMRKVCAYGLLVQTILRAEVELRDAKMDFNIYSL